MGYQLIVVDGVVMQHFGRIHHHAHHRIGHKWQNPQITSVWSQKIGHHDHLYWMHVKTGHLGDHHHFTIVFEIRNGMERLIDVHQGHRSIF